MSSSPVHVERAFWTPVIVHRMPEACELNMALEQLIPERQQRLLRVVGDEAEFSTWWDDREKHTVKLA